MVKVVRVPGDMKRYFTANELSGYPNGIRYTPAELKARRKYRAQNNLKKPVDVEPAKPFEFGKEVTQ